MKLRDPKLCDAERMLKWMHDTFVVGKLQTNFMIKTIDDCRYFINNSRSKTDIHLSIVDDNDLYMGTVSLKHITDSTAEFAIVVCREAMGEGYAILAMKEILQMGLEEYGLSYIYWCVKKENKRALRFYDKNHFPRTNANKIKIWSGYTKDQINSYVWYQTSSAENMEIDNEC